MNYVYTITSPECAWQTDIMLRSLARHTECTVLLHGHGLRDSEVEALVAAYPSHVRFTALSDEQWLDKRMTCRISGLLSLPFNEDDHVFVLDADLVVQDDIFKAFEDADFDVFLTSRHYDYWAPVNGGVWGFRWSHRTRRFVEFFVSQLAGPTWQPLVDFQEVWGHTGNLDWWIDQDFLCMVREHALPFRCRVADLGYRYNYCPPSDLLGYDGALAEMTSAIGDADYKILHFKGSLTAAMWDLF